MKEKIISFKTAKLAKKKGFNEVTTSHWEKGEHDEREGLFNSDLRNTDLESYEYSAPTQSLLQRWLREIHHINIEIFVNEAKLTEFDDPYYWEANVYLIRFSQDIRYDKLNIDIISEETYENALDKALKEALKSVIVNKTQLT